MSQITTHVLDTSTGRPARGVGVILATADGAELAADETDERGRIAELGPHRLDPGSYRLSFATGDYFAGTGRETFYPTVSIDFSVVDDEHYHVPLLISPYSYSTYRGN